MDKNEVIKIIKIEKECVKRNNGFNCDRKCEKCDLVLPASDIIKVYDEILKIIYYYPELFS